MNSMHLFTQENCARTRGHSEVLSFYSFCKDIIWSVWAHERVPWDFVSWGTKVNVFSLRLERIFHYALLLQMLRHPHAYKFFQAFPSMSQNLTMTKIRTSLQGKKKNWSSKQNLCFNQHLLHLLWFTHFVSAKCRAVSLKKKMTVFH